MGRGQGQLHQSALAFRAASSSGCASPARSPPARDPAPRRTTSALDPISTAKVEELIDELRERFTIVIVTHNMQQAARVSQRTAFFHLGELIEFGNTSEIFTNPHEQRTQTISPAVTADRRQGCSKPGHTLKALDEDIERLRALISQMGGLPSTRSEKRCAASRSATSKERRRSYRSDKKLDVLEIEDGTARGAADRASSTHGRRPSRRRRGAQNLRCRRAHRRLCQEYRTSVFPSSRTWARSSRLRCSAKWRGSRRKWFTRSSMPSWNGTPKRPSGSVNGILRSTTSTI